MESLMPKGTVFKALGWKRHTKRSLYGHYFIDEKCIDCGLTKKEFSLKFVRRGKDD